jgi:hypothetical protein
MNTSTNGTVSAVENLAFVAQCDLCQSFVERRPRQAEAEEVLRNHLRDYHNVKPRIVQIPKDPLFVKV